MHPAKISIAISLIAAPAMAQTSTQLTQAQLFSDNIVHIAAQAAYQADKSQQLITESRNRCDTVVRLTALGQRPTSNLGFCAVFDITLAEIAKEEHRPDADVIWKLAAHRVAADFNVIGIPPKQQPSLAREIDDRTLTQLRSLRAIATAPKQNYSRADGMGSLQITHLPDGTMHASLTTGGPQCGGEVTGPLVQQGQSIVMTRADDSTSKFDQCSLTMTEAPDSMIVTEQQCSAWHGGQCEFAGTYHQDR